MTRKLSVLVLVLMVVTFVLGSGVVRAADKITLRFGHFMPEKPGMIGAVTDQFFADEVKKRTNGAVDIKIYWSGTIGKTKELLGLVRDGSIDMAGLACGYYPAQFPLWKAANALPFVMTTVQEAIETSKRIPEEIPEVRAEIDKQNVKLLYHHVMECYHIFSTKPANTFASLKGLKLRTYGDQLPKAFHAAGAVGVTMYPAEVYEGLKRGVIDGGVGSVVPAMLLRIYEVAPHINKWNIMSIVGWGVFINQDKWKAIPPEAQKVMLEVAEEARVFEIKRALDSEKKSVQVLKAKGVTFHDVADSERQKWLEACPNFLDEWVAEMDKLGKGEGARKMKKLWLEIVAEK